MKLKWFKRILCSCFIMLALLAASSASEGAIFRVTPGGDGNKSGDSWANAMSEVEFRKALEDKTPGEYWVAEGEYTPHDSNPDKSFVLKKNIALYGGFAGTETQREERDWEANVTILSGAIGGLHSNNVVRATGVNSTAILDGFTITGGEATGGDSGGGMNIEYGSPTVTNCTFSGNVANNRGGGMNIEYGSPTLTNCTFSNNEASDGGGMQIVESSPTLTNCTFSGNKANYTNGGGMYISKGNPTLTNCTFLGNKTEWYGGGMHIEEGNPTLTNCTFSENEARSGGGMNIEYGSSTLTNCTFSENVAINLGGGMHIEEGNPTLTNCTFSENEATDGNGLYIREESPTLTNTIFWGAGSAAGQVVKDSGNPTITYSVVDTAVFPGEGNTKADPKLGPLADNGGPTKTCALLEGSSAIDSGTDAGAPSTDQRGVSRPQGSGYDMGAYEKEEAPVPPKPGSSGGGGCAAGPFSPWVLALLAPLAPIALRKRPGRRGR